VTDGSTTDASALSQKWQVPALLLGVVLLAVGWLVALPDAPRRDIAAELDVIRRDIAAGQFQEAITKLDLVLAEYDNLEDPLKIQYHLARADTIGAAQRDSGWSKRENHEAIVKHYRAAQSLEHQLDEQRLGWLHESLLALNKPDEADQVATTDTGGTPQARASMRREALGAALKREGPTDRVVQSLREFLADVDLSREHQIWAVARLAEAAITQGDHGDAAELLMRWLQRFEFATAKDVGELLVILGHAQLALGNRDAAERWYLQAQPMIEPGDPLHGQALAGLGRVRFAVDNIVEALEFYTDAVTSYPTSSLYVKTLVGKAECEARLGWTAASLETYDMAIEAIKAGRGNKLTRDALAASLRAQRDWRYSQREYATALDYLAREKRLHEPDAPPSLTLKLALTHERIAEQLIGLDPDQIDPRASLDGLTQQKRLEVVQHFEKAAQHYHEHARAVAKDQIDQYGESLWRAADCYDRSGLHDKAIEVFQEYARTQPNDPRQLQATFRLAQSYQAEAQFDAAAGLYKKLIDDNPKSPEAYASLVPLARCYLAKGLDSWDQAEHVLQSVVTDHEALRPESREYREALMELGRLYYRRGGSGDYERAIEALSEAVERYGNEIALPDLLFQLGDAYRKSVIQINARLREPLPPSEQSAFQAERASRLAAAQKAFDRAIKLYEASNRKRTALQALYLRNSYFYHADCAYDLGRFEGPGGAIELYDLAAKRYEKDPAVLVAQIQIVNSYCELGKYDQARTANERARWLLKRIKDEAFDDPNLPMSREHWQRWLDWTSELSLAERSAAVEP